jgi:hypothetical protein
MGIPIEELNRAGLVETGGELRKVKDARRTISETPAVNSGIEGDSGSTVEEAQDQAANCELPYPQHEELEDVVDEASERETTAETAADFEAGVSGMAREGRSQFRISVTLKVSNYGRRDPTGALETICDLITTTRRRLYQRLTERKLVGPISEPRRRGRKHHGGAVVKGKVPF